MKLSEVLEAINNDALEVDITENMDAIIMVQTAHGDKADVRGILLGDDDRMSVMVADRMVKSEEFLNMLTKALKYYMRYKLMEE